MAWFARNLKQSRGKQINATCQQTADETQTQIWLILSTLTKMESSVEKANPLAKKLAKIQDNQFENDNVF